MRHKISTALVLAALAAAPAVADEAWQSNLGPVIYEDEVGPYAVFLHYDGATAHRTFVRDLAGNFDNRGHFTGYWSAPEGAATDSPVCDVAIADENGMTTRHWGRIEIDFLRPGFPTEWDAQIGNCFDEPSRDWTGRLDDNFDYDGFGPQPARSPKH